MKLSLNFAAFLIAKILFYYFKDLHKMKKIALSLAVLFSVALVSCGNKQAEATDSDSVMVEDTTVVAEAANDSETLVVAEETVAETPATADSAK